MLSYVYVLLFYTMNLYKQRKQQSNLEVIKCWHATSLFVAPVPQQSTIKHGRRGAASRLFAFIRARGQRLFFSLIRVKDAQPVAERRPLPGTGVSRAGPAPRRAPPPRPLMMRLYWTTPNWTNNRSRKKYPPTMSTTQNNQNCKTSPFESYVLLNSS